MRNITIGAALLVAALFIVGCSEYPPLRTQDSKAEILASLNSELPSLLTEKGVDGLAMAVLLPGNDPFYMEFSDAKGLDEKAGFQFASLGKPVFASVILSLAEAGEIDLNAPLSEQAPTLFEGRDAMTKAITAKMILSHTSGLPNSLEGDPDHTVIKPGKKFHYSGVGYKLLQDVIEWKTKTPLEDLAQTFVFKSLGMKNSTYLPSDGSLPNASFTLQSNLKDYAKFVKHQMQTSDNQASSPNELLHQQIQISNKIAWGLGWGLQITEPNTSFWHWGNNPGYRSYVVAYPKEKIAVIVISRDEDLFKVIEPVIQTAIGGELPSYHWF